MLVVTGSDGQAVTRLRKVFGTDEWYKVDRDGDEEVYHQEKPGP